MRPTTVYISGPMQNKPGFNYAQFSEVENWLLSVEGHLHLGSFGGLRVINPATNFGGDTTLGREVYLELALRQVDESDAIVMLPGWEESAGARLELARALHNAADVYEWHPGQERGPVFLQIAPEAARETLRDTAMPMVAKGELTINQARAEQGLEPYSEPEADAPIVVTRRGPVFIVKDSGKRQEYKSGMQRDTQEGKPDYTLIDRAFLHRWAMHMVKGKAKYGEDNWRLADSEEEYKRFQKSALRHMMQWLEGDSDEDHAAAIAFNVAAAEYVKDRLAKVAV